MERRWSRDSSPNAPKSLQRKLAESRKPPASALRHNPPDPTEIMSDTFFATAGRKSYKLRGNSADDHEDFESSTRSNSSSRSTQEWLEEARHLLITSSSPSQVRDSLGKRVVSPRFTAAAQGRPSVSSLDGRDPLSRSARRHRKLDGISEEILSKSTVKHGRNLSDIPPLSASTPPNSPVGSPTSSSLPPRSSTLRRSRFRAPDQPHSSSSAAEAPPLLSPTKDASTFRTPASSSTSAADFACNQKEGGAGGNVLSPPRRIVESVHRRLVSSSTCSVDRNLVRGLKMIGTGDFSGDLGLGGVEEEKHEDKDKGTEGGLNAFLKVNRRKAEEVLCGARDARINVVLSGPSNS